MKAAVWHGRRDVRIEDRPVPRPARGQVRIKVDYAGICGTDRHEYAGPTFIPVSRPHRLTGRTAPLIMGHEFSGTVDALGEGVSGWSIGQRVTANGSLSCGECDMCRSGRFNICKKLGFVGVGDDGCFAEYLTVSADRCFAVPEGVTQRQAALAEPLACGIHATNLLERAGGVKHKLVVVVGPGIIGIGAFYAAKLAGARKVLVVGRGEEKRRIVEAHGGEFFNSSEGDVFEFVERWSGGALADAVYECAGTQKTMDMCVPICRPEGTIMVMGVFPEPPVVDMNTLQEAERTIMSSQAHVGEIAEALEYIRQGKIDADELVTGVVTLDTLVSEGFEELEANSARHIKVLVEIG